MEKKISKIEKVILNYLFTALVPGSYILEAEQDFKKLGKEGVIEEYTPAIILEGLRLGVYAGITFFLVNS